MTGRKSFANGCIISNGTRSLKIVEIESGNERLFRLSDGSGHVEIFQALDAMTLRAVDVIFPSGRSGSRGTLNE